MTPDWSRAPWPLRAHQRAGVIALLMHPWYALCDEVGCGKSIQVVVAAQVLFEQHDIDTVLVVAPGSVCPIWSDPDPTMGEVAKHAWKDVPNALHTYHTDTSVIRWEPHALNWIVTNYEFVRRPERLAALLAQLKGRRVWLIVEESWAVKTHSTANAKACRALRRVARRATLLNGTPVAESPLDLFSQMNILDPAILDCKYVTHFKARYAQMGGWQGKKIIAWPRLSELQAHIAPHVLRRITRECFDLPPVLPPITLAAALSEPNWRLYTQMRDDMVAALVSGEMSVANQAIVRSLRLSQITSGFLGGLDDTGPAPREIGQEKLDVLLDWIDTYTKGRSMMVWCRFRAEIARAASVLAARGYAVVKIWGDQAEHERTDARHALAPGGHTPVIGIGQVQAGGAGLNLSGASISAHLSSDFSLKNRIQADGRIDRLGQTLPIVTVDVIATGPKGQKTIDHHVVKALREKQQVADWTVSKWLAILAEV